MRMSVYFVAKKSLTTRIARDPDHNYRNHNHNHNYRRATGGPALSCRGLLRRTKRWATYCKGMGGLFSFDLMSDTSSSRHYDQNPADHRQADRAVGLPSSRQQPRLRPDQAGGGSCLRSWPDVVVDWLSLAIIINTIKCSIKQVGARVQVQSSGQDHCDLDLMLVSMDYTMITIKSWQN